MKKRVLLVILAVSALAACRRQVKPEAPPDYESSRRHAEESHQSLDKESSR